MRNRLDDAGLQGCPQTLSVRSSTQGWTNAAAGIGAGGSLPSTSRCHQQTLAGLMVGSAENVHSGSGGGSSTAAAVRMTLLQGQQLLNGQQFAHQRVRSPARPQGGDPFSGIPSPEPGPWGPPAQDMTHFTGQGPSAVTRARAHRHRRGRWHLVRKIAVGCQLLAVPSRLAPQKVNGCRIGALHPIRRSG